MAEPSNNPCSSSSKDDEYSDPLEVAASARARLNTPEKASILWKRKKENMQKLSLTCHSNFSYARYAEKSLTQI